MLFFAIADSSRRGMPPKNEPKNGMLLHHKNLRKEGSTTTTSSSTRTVGLDESNRTIRDDSESNLLLSDDNQDQQSRRNAGTEERHKDSRQLLHTRLSCLQKWRSGQTLSIHDTGKCTFSVGKSGPDIEICIREDNSGIVISSTVFRTDHAADANDNNINDDIISSSSSSSDGAKGGGVGGGEKNKKRTSKQKISYSLMTKMMQYNTMLNQSSLGGQVIMYDSRFVFYVHAPLSILEKSRYMDLVNLMDVFHVKATEISNEFASSAVMAQRKQLHLLRFRNKT
jgi:hypothetical protein